MAKKNDSIPKEYYDAGEEFVQDLYRNMYYIVHTHRLRDVEFTATLEQKWNDTFVQMEAFRIFNIECAEKYQEQISSLEEQVVLNKQYKNIVLREIHGRACQMFLEITCLLKHGLADGAFARWRSLYELAVLSKFIYDNNETTAEAYFNQTDSDDTTYEWARVSGQFTSTERITFKALQDKVGYDKESIWAQQYKFSNNTIHLGPQGTFKRLAISKTPQAILVGESDYGIHLPADHAILSLALIACNWFMLFEFPSTMLCIYAINKWIHDFQYNLYKTASRLFPEDVDLKNAWDILQKENCSKV